MGSIRGVLLLACVALLACFGVMAGAQGVDPVQADVTQGALRVVTGDTVVECPLKHTEVKAGISGFLARVNVTQTFYNPSDEKIEAVYVFPLPHTAAIDGMTMTIGERTIVGKIKRRADARALYEQALQRGMTAALLEQERPNIFTQSVGNIKPQQEVRIEISYVDVLKYDMGTYEFSFPMVVGPRYNPRGAVADAARITPPSLKPGERNGHDISLSLKLDAGVPVHDLKVVNHKADVKLQGQTGATLTLSPDDAIPNKDFVLRYTVVGEKPALAVLTNAQHSSGYFMLMLQPAIEKELATAPPREVVFLIDVSGSMSGEPTAKVKQTMQEFFKRSKPEDTIQVITFAGSADKLFANAVPATAENTARALNFTDGIQAGGGTEMLQGIKKVLEDPVDPQRVRIVVMLTDGYIGNEAQIIEEVGKRAGDQLRFWTLGIGSSPNRFLLDGVAKQGGGGSAVIELNTDPAQIVGDVTERMHRAQLSKISVDWGNLPVYDVLPRRVPELWAGRPVILFGKYSVGGAGKVTISGTAEGKPISYSTEVELPYTPNFAHDVLGKVWARQKIQDLSEQVFYADDPVMAEEITRVALEYGLMSQYTSFVAIDTSDTALEANPTPPRRVMVPLPIPDGTVYEGFYGNEGVGYDFDYQGPVQFDSTQGASADKSLSTSRIRVYAKSNMTFGRTKAVGPSGHTLWAVAAKPPVPYTAPAEVPIPAPLAFDGAAVYTSKESVARESGIMVDAFRSPTVEQADLQKRRQTVQTALTEAYSMQKKGFLLGAQLRAQYAYALAASIGETYQLPEISALIQQVSYTLTQEAEKTNPLLSKKLDLVLRDQSISEALQTLQREAGVPVLFVSNPEDADGEYLGMDSLRVTYLDLRHATVAQALDWLLTPAHLTWRAEKEQVVVGTTRRLTGDSAWVYTVTGLIDSAQQTERDALLKIVRHFIGQQQDDSLQAGSAIWLNSGQILVYGDKDAHERVASLLEALKGQMFIDTDPITPGFSALQQQTIKRWNENAAQRTAAQANRAQGRVLLAMRDFSWALLSAATGGTQDDEALTELRIAWKAPACAEAVGKAPNLALQSAWLIALAAQQQPQDAQLRALANTALAAVGPVFQQVANTLGATPDDPAAYHNALLGVLLAESAAGLEIPHGIAARAPAVRAVLLQPRTNEQLAREMTLASAYLAPTAATDNALAALITGKQFTHDSWLLLATLTARQRGGSLRQTLLQELPELTSAQPLDSHAIIAINHLLAKAE